MPEGPSIRILREEAVIFKGKKVLEVSGNSKEDIGRMENKKVKDLKSWGKHFLICFDHFTVRIHLMLFGSYRINEVKENATPRLSLRFANGELNFYTCSVKFIEGDINEAYDWQVDIMSDKWNPKKALASLKEAKKMMVTDALLDQNIFAGSGNIIKNEVLFNIRLHPATLLGDIPDKKLKELVKETSSYSFDFYRWKKAYELKKHWLAYHKNICPRCDIPLVIKDMGKGKRRTFFCENCQLLYKNGEVVS
jgi:endonuclease-8